MLAQDITIDKKQIPCSSSGYHILTEDDYYKYIRVIDWEEYDK